MDFGRFLDEHRGQWRQLETLLDSVETDGLKAQTAEDVRDLARLYRKASADLLLTRDVGGRADVVDYLEALVGRSYTAIYSPQPVKWSAALKYLTRGWPLLLRRERSYVLSSVSIFGLGFLLAFVLVLASPAAFEHLVPDEFALFYGTAPDDLRQQRFGAMDDADSAAFSSMLMVNNIRVTINSFAFGLTFGIGTFVMLLYNGVLLGAIAGNFTTWGQGIELWAVILPHGVVEIFAMNLGGGAGLIIADALLRPGRRKRLDALRERGVVALKLMGMAVPLLVLAGFIEGYVTPMEMLSPVAKLIFAAGTAVMLGIYLRAPWLHRGEAADADAADSVPT